MKIKRGERRKFGGVGRKEGENCRQTIQKPSLFARKTQTLNCLQRNLNIFIASIYRVEKVLKERM